MIVDDKGLVVLVNFGLLGSTFPGMIAERAMPFITHIQVLLKSELGIGCRIGATHGRAFCGLVTPGNPGNRTEYTVLGSSVNLAARLMAHVRNPGILVDEAIQMRAGRRPFRSLCPIRAKGYRNYVRIFIPETTQRSEWKACGGDFVGRVEELATLISTSKDIIFESTGNSHNLRTKDMGRAASRMTFVEGPYGIGKSCLLDRAAEEVELLLVRKQSQHCIFRHVCCDEDSFKPFR
jgi:Adenylate and Guanylate cyclase catalytic domain